MAGLAWPAPGTPKASAQRGKVASLGWGEGSHGLLQVGLGKVDAPRGPWVIAMNGLTQEGAAANVFRTQGVWAN